MIASVACLLAIVDQQTVGQKWHYDLTWHFTNKEIDLTDEESFDVEVTAVKIDSVTLRVSQKLVASIVDSQRILTDPKAVPSVHEWALASNGSVAFMPNSRFSLESRLFRILKGIMPEPKGDLSRIGDWTVELPDDGLGMPMARLNVSGTKTTKESSEFALRYREKNGTNGAGTFVRRTKTPLPANLVIHFTNTKMSGGSDIVDCDLTMKLKPEK